MISGSSVLSALLLHSVMLFAICRLCKNTRFLEIGGGSVLMLASVLAALRLILPLEIPYVFPIRSWRILGGSHRLIRAYPVILFLGLTIWGVGALVVLWKDIKDLNRACKESHKFKPKESKITEKIVARSGVKCPVVVSPNVPVPYVVGIINHTIYLPYPELSERATELVLAHEAQHIKHHDTLIKLFFGGLSAALWWNSLRDSVQKTIDALLEMHCDREVTKNMTENEKTEYLETLTDVAKQAASQKRPLALAINEFCLTGRQETVLEQRAVIINSTRKRKPSLFLSIVMHSVVVAIFVASYFVMFAPAGRPTEEKFEEKSGVYYYENYADSKIEVEIDSAFIIKESDGRYKLFVDYMFKKYLSDDEIASEEYQHLHIFEEDIS